ncbi:Gti1/Pac2 family-domain-containing protein [Xylaria arbuscula]|nr:Gti1/Pac2 family-domain-containing protein [Xylaria arbuscula]
METYFGYVRTPADAIKLFEACRIGALPRVQRRLSEKERQSIRAGSVFVWDEREAGMRRWTDGKSWSASRVSGSFLTYREMEGKRGGGFGTARKTGGRSPDSGRVSDDEQDGEPEGYRYKTDGLMKQSFSITTTSGQHLHLISYYARPPMGVDFPVPSTDPSLKNITPVKGMYPETSAQETNPPPLTRGPMQPYTHSPGLQDHGAYGGEWAASPAWTGALPAPRSPYSHGNREREPGLLAHPVPRHLQRAPQLPPSPHSTHSTHSTRSTFYDRLPPPAAYQTADQHSSLSPRSQHLQEQAAQAVLIDPWQASSVRNPQGPLPIMTASNRHPSPPRANSLSPHSGSARKASLSNILLHPRQSSSEPTSANPANNSAESSPRDEDARAIQALDRRFKF